MPPKPKRSQPRDGTVLRWAPIIVSSFLATSLAQTDVLKQPLQRLLKDDLLAAPEAMANFFGIATVGWYIKPVLGLLSDSAPLWGSRRRSYLIAAALLAAGGWVALGAVPRTYGLLLAAAIGMNLMLAMASTVAGAILVEAGHRLSAAGRLVSLRNGVEGFSVLVAGPLAGFLAALPFAHAAWAAAAIAASVAPVAWLGYREGAYVRPRGSAFAQAGQALAGTLRSPAMQTAALFVLLAAIPPGFAPTVLYYHQRDRLEFSSAMIGTLGLVAGAGSILAAAVYGYASRHLSLRWLLCLGVAAAAGGSLGYAFYGSYGDALAIEAVNGFLSTLTLMAFMQLAVLATPANAAALGFALLMGVLNLGTYLSDLWGASLFARHSAGFLELVWIKAGATALMVAAVWLLPRNLLARSDDGPAPMGSR